MLSQQVATGPLTASKLIKFHNCRILRNHKIVKEDLWVRGGKIIDPEKVFFDEKRRAHLVWNRSVMFIVTRSDLFIGLNGD